jgi:type VI secretion system Hcp family effector
MAFQAHLSVKGKKQGQFKGEGAQNRGRSDWISILGFSMGVKSPRDAGTGLPNGKRQLEPVTIDKEWGAASPQALTACSTNEVLTGVTIEFLKTNPNGEEYVFQTVQLTNANIFQVERYLDEIDDKGAVPLERWSFTFQKIQVDDKDGKTTFADDWSTPA